jgi:predicted AlkP superfamily pyrophosphatase or phosphodiesterase
MKFDFLPLALAATVAITGCAMTGPATTPTGASRVLLIGVDGLHQQDVANCMAANTCPAISKLAQTGVNYTHALTPGLSDSFPGLAALLTGGSAKSTGLFYDVTYDRTLYSPADKTCSGTQGWNVVFDGTTGFDGMNGGPLTHLDGGGKFNPQSIPHAKVKGHCGAVYPHNYIQTNTVFEVVKEQIPGARTAWADKHAWAYDWVNGPSGKGVDDLPRTEIDSIDTATGTAYSDKYLHTQVFDNFHVKSIIHQINGKDSTGTTAVAVPTVFGGNFQTLSVAQKALSASGGGYKGANFTPGPQVAGAMAYIDASLAKIVAELKAKNLLNSTLIIVTAKHGQSPGDFSKLVKVGDTLTALMQANGYVDAKGKWGQHATVTEKLNDGSGLSGTGATETDTIGLVWLKNQDQLAAALATLNANLGCKPPGICADGPQARILSGTALVSRFGDPAQGRVPDIVVYPNPGVIYSGSKKKDAEHGGDSPDDSHVALMVSMPSLAAQTNTSAITITQVAPTILLALKLDPALLNSVKLEGTRALPGLGF